jgi:hypothetical protein
MRPKASELISNELSPNFGLRAILLVLLLLFNHFVVALNICFNIPRISFVAIHIKPHSGFGVLKCLGIFSVRCLLLNIQHPTFKIPQNFIPKVSSLFGNQHSISFYLNSIFSIRYSIFLAMSCRRYLPCLVTNFP